MKNQITMCPFCGCKSLYLDDPNEDSDGMDVMTSYDGDYEICEPEVVLVRCKESKSHSFFVSKKEADYIPIK